MLADLILAVLLFVHPFAITAFAVWYAGRGER